MIDELLPDEILKIKNYLSLKTTESPIKGLYWLELPENSLDDRQREFVSGHGPLKIALEIGKSWLRIELLVKSESLTNEGGGDLNKEQFNFILNFYNNIINFIKRENYND
jgi:hypothetical protein